ncbi:CTD small phosphatase-like protein 2-B isoform X1 [Takifugu flavidus]|uniref:FCP1 homology domain-containing protein n=2 Tax=Takifugu TaxID=31032 RepID=A0A4Z2B5Z5_9TELE|nr:CTD small phosphatase-like protein 2-B isoform X1 [Takifugu flavidus]TNM87794.1 hypothetical protein fugu_006015 [Takifugu bimaculatus]
MRLRSQKTLTPRPETPKCSRRPSNKATPRPTRLTLSPESPVQTKSDVTTDNDLLHADNSVPTMRRRPLPGGRQRRRAIAVGTRETAQDVAFKTPARPILRREHILRETDPVATGNTTARNIYSPIVRFLTPSKENVTVSDRGNVLMSPEQCVFSLGSIDLLAEDEEEDIFNPCRFIKNMPSQSQFAQPQLRDIPPKTRSTPEATLVVDLEETLMFSSLNVIDEAEYTFDTTFQDHQYKVYMKLRPHVKEFLQSVAKNYELFVYTCAKREYAEKILNILDPQRKVFRHRLYQEDCICVLGHYIKDLSILGRDLTKTVVLDNMPHTYPYHLLNTIPIKSWTGEPEDRELQKLVPTLERLTAAEDFREVLKKRKDHFHRLLSED